MKIIIDNQSELRDSEAVLTTWNFLSNEKIMKETNFTKHNVITFNEDSHKYACIFKINKASYSFKFIDDTREN